MNEFLFYIAIQTAIISFAWVNIITDADGILGPFDKFMAENTTPRIYKAVVGCTPCNSFYFFFMILSINVLFPCCTAIIDIIFFICLTMTIAKLLQKYI